MAKSPDFRGISESLSVPIPGKSPWRFSTRADYIRFLVERQEIAGESELLMRPDLVVSVQRHWHGRAQHACRFAQLLSKFPDQHGWATLVIRATDDSPWSDAIWQDIVDGIKAALGDAATHALSIFAPGVLTESGLVQFIRDLRAKAGWMLTEDVPNGYPKMRTIGLRAELPVKPSVASWAIGFGPFDFLPLTRQAPFTEIAIATKPKPERRRSPRLSDDRTIAHLADVPIDIADKTFETWWPDTQKGKKIMLGGADDSLAKAKVTFAIPAALWSKNS